MSARGKQFAEKWVSENVHHVPGMDDPGQEARGTRAKFVADARSSGIEETELSGAVGDIDEFLTEAYENAYDPEAGFR